MINRLKYIYVIRMIENTNQPQYMQNGKPVNINISFNISRKQVMQNINPI